jgi:dolichyl-phosphate-mannose-protein mannosyltransferase
VKPKTSPKQARPTASSTLSPSLPASISLSQPITRLELTLIAAIVISGAVLRLFALSYSAVEHFDEGIYASNIYFGEPDYAYPLQRYYAPPLLPALIEAGMVLQLPPNLAALLPSFLAGCGTMIVLWWFGRTWFGPAAGISAATLAAFSDFQILFSTAALTDALLGLWLLLAVDAIARSLMNGDLRWAVGAGLYTGLAWWSKYNGWLPLAIEAAGIGLLLLLANERRGQLRNWLICFAVTTFVAVAVWLPYWLSLRTHGGYSPIAANHAKYLVGFSGWLNALSRQLANQQAIEGWTSAVGIFLATVLPTLLDHYRTRQRLWQFGSAAALAVIALFSTSFVVITAISLCGLLLAASMLFNKLADSREQRPQFSIGLALVAAWWLGLFITTPCYTPYARLTLPFMLAAYLAASTLNPRLLPANVLPRGSASSPQQSLLHCRLSLVACSVALVISLAAARLLPRPPLRLSRNRLALHAIATDIHKPANENTPRVFYTYAEPALFFQLHAAGEPLVSPIQHLPTTAATIEGQRVPTFLLLGPHSEKDARFQREWIEARDRWKLIQTFDYQPSPLVYLDLHDPRVKSTETAQNSIHLYQITDDK